MERLTHRVFVTGGTGYLGSRLIPLLTTRGHRVRALTRKSSQSRVPSRCEPVIGDALDADTFRDAVIGCDTFVQLVGVSHPSPSKSAQFRSIDLASARASIDAATYAECAHFVYVSVAQPAPMMREYVAARAEAEAMLRERIAAHVDGNAPVHPGIAAATIVRPWYVLGPGHRWPSVLKPAYWLAERIPSTRDQALRLGLVTIAQMLETLVAIVEQVGHPATGIRIVEVPEIRSHEGR